ncbi:two-component system histidine kinase PnpS [Halalkalibacter krulwichiae]|uniref:histidine kinase n=1 Tax=Halalkalibacter krulwichiae TaxID=199441 RepID=A0A1X9ME24_9BACI|nr:ATP-binding protein [Halalkalibacter krulwichiae]ARK31695.1 Alkaline phosphatase synthesis sensor protein PhoR [Halalkalibacter krulwichiae]
MYKLRFKLVFAVLSITFFVMAGLGLVIGQFYQNFFIDHLTDRIAKEAKMASFVVGEEGVDPDTAERLADTFASTLDARVTIILVDGTVIADSAADPTQMDNHLVRPEIVELKKGNEEAEIRYSETVNDELLYYAVTITNSAGEDIGYIRLGISTETLAEMNAFMWRILAICFSIAFFVIFIIIYRVANEMIRPIEDATVVANELAEGNFKARTQEGKRDEIGQLSRSINILAYNLGQLTKRHEAQKERMQTLIENMGSGLILINTKGDITLINRTCRSIFQEDTDLWINQLYHDVIKHKEVIRIVQTILMTEEKQRKQIHFPVNLEVRHFEVYGAPVMSNRGKLKGIVIVLHDITELKKLEQVRTDFVANVSHELKTPVTSIKGFTETLLDGAMNSEPLRENFLNIIAKESERLQALIEELLELSRIEQSYFKLHWQNTDLNNILLEVYDLLKEKAAKKNISLKLEREGDTRLEGDPSRLKQIVINLVNNAIMYTSDGGHVSVVLKENGESVELAVIDTGVGIKESELPRIFERFYRVDRARSRNSGGTGLGLAIVKHLVEAHSGQINVESEMDKGTTFLLKFKKQQQNETE